MKSHPLGLKIKPITKAIGCALAFSSLNLYAAEAPSDDDSAESSNKVIITGSRIRADEANDTVPIEVIIAEDAIDRGITDVGQLLRESTLASGSAQVTAATSSAFVQNGGTGVETLSLRGLGAGRTLVLLNGRRAGPAGTRGATSAFDFNTIPLSAVERIEILKDGASSLYGSDAVAGVVNIITKTSDGGTIEVFRSQPEDDGGEQTRISGSWGDSFDNGSYRLTFDHNVTSELKRGDRDYFACGERYYFDAATGARTDIIDPRTGKPHCSDLSWGHVWLYDYGASNLTDSNGLRLNLAQFDYDGDLGNYIDAPNPQGPADFSPPPGWFAVNGVSPVLNADHPFQDRQSLIPEVTRSTVMATGDYDFTQTLSGYAEVLFNRRETESQSYRQFWTYKYNENFFGGEPLSAGWTGAQWLSPTAITDHSFQNITVDYSRFVVGLKGQLGEWYWDASIQSSRSDGDYENAIIYDDAISPYTIFQGFSGSCVGMNTPVRGVPCRDVAWLDPEFLAGNISAEDRAFLFGKETGNTVYKQHTLEATITGDAFEMPHGVAGVAFGLQYQIDDIKDKPGDVTLANNTWGSTGAGITEGDSDTYAVFGEINLPLLAGLPGVEELNLTASARYTDVKDIDSDTTYKVGLAWHIGAGWTIRGSHGTSFRTPALYELYLADQTSFVNQRAIDPCINWGQNLADGQISQRVADNCAADGLAPTFAGGAISATVFTGGGAGILKPETSESNTWGIVWRPEFADLSISVDYFDFEIEDEVTQLGAANLVGRCYASEFFPNDPLCAQFDRATGPNEDMRITVVRDSFINIARQDNKGYDFDITYRTDLPSGKLTLQTKHTIQDESARGIFADTVQDFNGTLGEPKHTGTFLARYDRNNWNVSWFTNIIGPTENDPDVTGVTDTFTFLGNETRRVGDTPRIMYHSLSFGYDHEESGIGVVVGVRNMFDKEPPRISRGMGSRAGNSAFYSQYDWVGRSIFVNAKYDF
ncbi:TonB-dependent siderophore receptor [Kangiella sp. TOML190]|uniref:TonB-dependent receptor plug domain-containing protein n=1 Tax=Kangiella sp. TOML190 TaxID=2931351 RepID=UPI00204079E5|nr:TonB-dependent receptor [Kangiella sp. TOML190]